MGDAVMTDAELADELAWTPPEVLLTLKQNSSTARQFALDWYTRRLFSAAAESDGTFRRVPGLEAAAAERARRLVTVHYIQDLMAERYAPSRPELKQFYRMNKAEVCAAPASYQVARTGVVSGRRAGPEESAAAQKRLAEMQQRLSAGDSFAEVADQLSDLSNRQSGGEIGWLNEKTSAGSPGFVEIQALSPGQWTQPIPTKDGEVIYFLMAKQDAGVKSFAECLPILEQSLNMRFRREIVLGRVDELAEELNASFNMEAFLAIALSVESTVPPRSKP